MILPDVPCSPLRIRGESLGQVRSLAIREPGSRGERGRRAFEAQAGIVVQISPLSDQGPDPVPLVACDTSECVRIAFSGFRTCYRNYTAGQHTRSCNLRNPEEAATATPRGDAVPGTRVAFVHPVYIDACQHSPDHHLCRGRRCRLARMAQKQRGLGP